MRLGFFGINIGACADPAGATAVAQAAEECGYDSVWTGEHVVLPDPQAPPSPSPPDSPFLDPAVALAYVAAGTRTIKLATGIIILPQRNPAVLAKEMASVDVVSGGRLIFGIGIGYLKPEFDALGIPFDRKGARSDDYLAAILALWTQPQPSHRGEFVSFAGIQAMPRPVQRPHPPIVVGGGSPQAFRRALRHGNGWYGFARSLATTAEALAAIRDARAAVDRPPALGDLEITITPTETLDRDTVRRYEDLGVHRLAILGIEPTTEKLIALIRTTADRVRL